MIGRSHRPRSIGIIRFCGNQPADVFLKISFLDKALDLVPQLEAFKGVVPPVLVEFVVFPHVSPFRGSSHWARVLEQIFSFYLHEYLFPRRVKWGVAIEAARKGFRSRGALMSTLWPTFLLLRVLCCVLLLSFRLFLLP